MLELGDNGAEFELFVGYLFEREGFRVWTTPKTGDDGVDLFLVRDKASYVVQCKQYRSNKVSSENVRQLPGIIEHEKADGAILVTTSGVAEKGRNWAEGKLIRFIEAQELEQWASRINLASQNHPGPSLRERLEEWATQLGRFFRRQPASLKIAFYGLSGFFALLILLANTIPAAPAVDPPNSARAFTPTLPVSSNGSVTQIVNNSSNFGPTALTTSNEASSEAVLPTTMPTTTATPTPRPKDAVSAPCLVGQIKGNTQSKFYHEPGWPYYNSFPADSPIIRCFDNSKEAEAAGFKPGLRPASTPKPRP